MVRDAVKRELPKEAPMPGSVKKREATAKAPEAAPEQQAEG
jgi:hypothetical protein